MLITITLVLSILVVINFLLLIFSCNKSSKKLTSEKPVIIKSVKVQKPTKQLATSQLAATGS